MHLSISMTGSRRKVLNVEHLSTYMKKRLIVLGLVLFIGCVGQKKSYTEEESLKIAEEFVKNDETYKFDGGDLTHVTTTTLGCPSCWEFTFTFTSRSGGYGDRKGQMTIQVITPHTAKVTVENGKVTRAVLDDEWDMITETFIE